MKLNKLGSYVLIILRIGFVLGIITLLIIPLLTKMFSQPFDLFVLMIYPCGICFLLLVKEFVKMFKTIEDNNPFCNNNVFSLNKSKNISFIISILILIALIFSQFLYDYYSLQLKVCLGFVCLLFFAIGIALYILKELFAKAVFYKEENDLTI